MVNQKHFNLDHYFIDSPTGFFLEVGVDFADELHDFHNDHPLTGKEIKATEDILSKYQLKKLEQILFFLLKTKKLVPNLGNKRKYKLRYQNLKL